MARIRSVKPGLWTDDRFMGLSDRAQLTWIGLWNEADDQGVFAWKPLTLKARLAPVSNCDMAAMLQELLAADVIRRFTIDAEHDYGAIRNFQAHQKPKKPHVWFPLPANLRSYVGARQVDQDQQPEPPDDNRPWDDYEDTGSPPQQASPRTNSGLAPAGPEVVADQFATSGEPVRHQFGTGGEKSSLVEKERNKDTTTTLRGSEASQEVFRNLCDTPGIDPTLLDPGDPFVVEQWLAVGCDPLLDIYPQVRRILDRDQPVVRTLRMFSDAVLKRHARRTQSRGPVVVPLRAAKTEAQRAAEAETERAYCKLLDAGMPKSDALGHVEDELTEAEADAIIAEWRAREAAVG